MNTTSYLNKCHFGDVRDMLRRMIADGVKVNTIVTSPPYWGLRSYLPADHPDKAREIGSEPTLREFLDTMNEVFDLCREVLADDGTMWVNMGDSYATDDQWGGSTGGKHVTAPHGDTGVGRGKVKTGLPPKSLIGQPWRLAFALQDAGWILRQDIIWCLSGGAWVYARTQKGDMPVMVKDMVRLDPRTVKLWNGAKWTQVLGWGRSNDETERLELVLRSGERIGCTGGHQWPTQRGNVVARELRIGDAIKTCRLPQPDACARPAYLTDDALWLIGLYLAEGSRSKSNARQLSLNADEQEWLPRIAAVARHYGGSCSHTVDGNKLAVRIYGKVLHTIIDAYIGGDTAIDKHLRVAAWRLPDDALSSLAQGYLDGDGRNDSGNDRWRLGFCRNYSLERDLRTLAARLEATLTLKPGTATYQAEWRWERSGHWNEKDRGEVVEIRASRARGFWDIAVEDEPHLFALASGVLTHNCKPNPMPESVKDRCTKAHEYIFLLSKSERYRYDFDAVLEPVEGGAHARRAGPNAMRGQGSNRPEGGGRANRAGRDMAAVGQSKTHLPGNVNPPKGQAAYEAGDESHRTKGGLLAYSEKTRKLAEVGSGTKNNYSMDAALSEMRSMRNRRSVWTVASEPYKGSHFATFPTKLIEHCILAGAPVGGIVFDPFFGSGTTGQVAQRLGRNFIGIDINQANKPLQDERLQHGPGLQLEAG